MAYGGGPAGWMRQLREAAAPCRPNTSGAERQEGVAAEVTAKQEKVKGPKPMEMGSKHRAI